MADTDVNTYLWSLIVIQISTSIDLGHGFKKANTNIFIADEFLFCCSLETSKFIRLIIAFVVVG